MLIEARCGWVGGLPSPKSVRRVPPDLPTQRTETKRRLAGARKLSRTIFEAILGMDGLPLGHREAPIRDVQIGIASSLEVGFVVITKRHMTKASSGTEPLSTLLNQLCRMYSWIEARTHQSA